MPRTVTIHHPELKIKKKPWGTKKEDVIKRGRDCTTTTHRRQFCCCSCVCVVEERTIDGGYSGPHHRRSCLWTPNASSVRSGFEKFDGCAVFRGAPSTRSIYLSSSWQTWTHRWIVAVPRWNSGCISRRPSPRSLDPYYPVGWLSIYDDYDYDYDYFYFNKWNGFVVRTTIGLHYTLD